MDDDGLTELGPGRTPPIDENLFFSLNPQAFDPGPYHPYLPYMEPFPIRPSKKRIDQYVWPKDKRQRSCRFNLSRVTDCLTGKGPDIWVASKHDRGPHRPVWSGWSTKGINGEGINQYPEDRRNRWDNLGYEYKQLGEVPNPIKSLRREDGKVYDFRSRKYVMPHPGVLSDVKWSGSRRRGKKPCMPLYTRDYQGCEWVDPIVDDGNFNLGGGFYFHGMPVGPCNPFAHDPWSEVPNWVLHEDLP